MKINEISLSLKKKNPKSRLRTHSPYECRNQKNSQDFHKKNKKRGVSVFEKKKEIKK